MIIKRYIEELPVEHSELSSKTVSSDKIQSAIQTAQKRSIMQKEMKENNIKPNETA